MTFIAVRCPHCQSEQIVKRGKTAQGTQQRICAGCRGNTQLTEVPNPPEQQAYYRVEEEFTNAIRGKEEITMVPFETGVHYMEWTEAVIRSAQTGQAIYLPL